MLHGMTLFKQAGVADNMTSTPFEHEGGTLCLIATGTFDSGTVKLQFTPDNDSTWIDVPAQNGGAAMALTANGSVIQRLPQMRMRLAVTGVAAAAAALNIVVGMAAEG